MIYSFESGTIECLSQIDLKGQLVILLKSLKENISVEFRELMTKKSHSQDKGFVLKALMVVKQDTNLCKNWTDVQEVTIVIDPLPVERITLTGKPIYTWRHVTVLSPNISIESELSNTKTD